MSTLTCTEYLCQPSRTIDKHTERRIFLISFSSEFEELGSKHLTELSLNMLRNYSTFVPSRNSFQYRERRIDGIFINFQVFA